MKADKRAPTARSAAASARQADAASSRKRAAKKVAAKPAKTPKPARPHSTRRALASKRRATPASAHPRPDKLPIPPMLLEKEPPAVVPSVTGAGPTVATELDRATAIDRPQLNLTPRDPHWLHAHWRFSPDHVRDAGARSEGGQLALRLFEHSPAGRLVSETRVRAETARWFVHVEQAGTSYAGQIGYYDRAHKWVPLASSPPVRTPPNGPSAHGGFALATLAQDGTLERHGASHTLIAPWPAEREAALHALARGGSPEFSGSESFLPGAKDAVSPAGASWGAPSSFSSLLNVASGFRLEVNAELIVYGATEPDAELTIGGKPVALSHDGSFRFRFALPDGDYELPIHAKSARNSDERRAALKFSRRTDAKGEVGQHPQEPGLQPPG